MSDQTKVFGVPLSEVMSRASERTIPTFIKKIIRYLNQQAIDTEVIFRIGAKPQALNALKQRIDSGEDPDFFEMQEPHLVANLLKIYLKELPEPLFTYNLYPQFVAASTDYEAAINFQRAKSGTGFGDDDDSHTLKYVEQLSKLVDELPPANKALAEILLLFLSRVGEHSAKNKMTPANLGIVFGQLLLRPDVETIESMMNASKITGIMKFMIEHFEKVFPKQKARSRQPRASVEGAASVPQQSEEQEKLQKIKETVDDAIVLVQKKLNSMSVQLKETEQLEVALDIARRVRTAKKVLFPPGEEPRSTRLPTKRVCGFTLQSAAAERQGKRKTMEDAYLLNDDLTQEYPSLSGTWAFYAVYDGHGGSQSSHTCSNLLHKNLINSPQFAANNFKEAFANAYEETDRYILEANIKDGSTAVTVLLNGQTLIVANAGDSEAVLCKIKDDGNVEGVVITETHRPTLLKEKQRIEKAGGAVFSGRVFGALAVSRSLGDGDYKIPASEANFVTSEPYVNVIELTKEYSFLLLACDGLFDKLTAQEAVEFVHGQLQSGTSLNEAANELTDYALSKRTTDNVTAVLVKFNWKS